MNANLQAALKQLKENKVTAIDLSSNWIGVEGAKSISEALKTNKSLTSIHLSYNNIEAEGAKSIGEALKINKSLTSINLSNNYIGVEGAKSIGEALERNKSIPSLLKNMLLLLMAVSESDPSVRFTK